MKELKLLYEDDVDLLYVKFADEPPGSMISLNDLIVLRYDPLTRRGLGLTFVSLRPLLPSGDGCAPSYSLRDDFEMLPSHIRDAVWEAITHPPVSEHLRISRDTDGRLQVSLISQPVILLTLQAKKQPHRLVYGQFSGAQMSTEEDFHLAEWQPTEMELSGA